MIRIEAFESRLLRGNPLGDPHVRQIPVYLPPSYGRGRRRYPVITLLAGFTGSGESLLNRQAWVETHDEYHLHHGARMLAARLRRHGIRHVHEEFPDGHANIPYRYDRSFALLSRAMGRA